MEISLIVEALTAGASEALKDGARDTVVAAYGRLRDEVVALFAGNHAAEVVLAKHERAPEIWHRPLAAQLAESGADTDLELHAAAKALLALLRAATAGASKYNIVVHDSQVFSAGDHNHQTINVGSDSWSRKSAEPSRPAPGNDPSRDVFVVYGRDEEARLAVFAFLRALGLNPLEWETLLQRRGDAAPYLGQAIRTGLAEASAVVVLMTPDDVTRLHPHLHGPHEKPGEVNDTLQPRPNVLIELGMALAAKDGKVVLLKAGDQREITDLNGYSYVRLADTAECRTRIRERLQAAGCRISASTDWLTAGDFATLKAISRTTA